MSDHNNLQDQHLKDFLEVQEGETHIFPQWLSLFAFALLLGVVVYMVWQTLQPPAEALVIKPYEEPLKQKVEAKLGEGENDLAVLELNLPRSDQTAVIIDQENPPNIANDQRVAHKLLSGEVDRKVAVRASDTPKASEQSPEESEVATPKPVDDPEQQSVAIPPPPISSDNQTTGYLRDEPNPPSNRQYDKANSLRLKEKLIANITESAEQLEKLRTNRQMIDELPSPTVEQSRQTEEVMSSISALFDEPEQPVPSEEQNSELVNVEATTPTPTATEVAPETVTENTPEATSPSEVAEPPLAEPTQTTVTARLSPKRSTAEAPTITSEATLQETPVEENTPSSPTSAFYVQVASLPNPQDAQKTVDRFQKRHQLLLEQKQISIVKVSIPDKGDFHRLYVSPFDSRSLANDWCQRLRNARGDCIVIRPKT